MFINVGWCWWKWDSPSLITRRSLVQVQVAPLFYNEKKLLSMMRDSDVKSLLIEVESVLEGIKKSYDQAIQDKDVPDSLRIKIKNVMENLRSALDYMAKDIYEQFIRTGKIERGFLGVLPQDLEPDMAEAFGLEGLPLVKAGAVA